jgi:hypothetical protein
MSTFLLYGFLWGVSAFALYMLKYALIDMGRKE